MLCAWLPGDKAWKAAIRGRGMAWVEQSRSGSHPRFAPERSAIADKVRSYDGRNAVPPANL
ncbi:hypothetical protein Pssp01_22920 [Pseudomonas sp. NBRC 100443]|nr:hypothetical protein Pssp01_22920 [Pseudomonas sp. NBRC 100443]